MMYEEMNKPCLATCEPSRETLKAIMENMSAILQEMDNVTNTMCEAFYGERTEQTEARQEVRRETILQTLSNQRDLAERIHKKIVKIREGLW